ncbi:MAG: amidohydrolase family protein [Chitinophagaceae bacterium]|nr:amidohydrolase family protein [Chitinophagaceae bacterium]
MQRIDSHQHFWKYDAVRHSWINDEMAVIRKDFYPPDLQLLLVQNNMDGCVAVQADQTLEETYFLLELAKNNPFIKGVVGWVDLKANNIHEQLAGLSKHKLLKGFRHVLQAESQDDYMLQKDFLHGIAALEQYNFTYDILVFPRHLKYVKEFVKLFQKQKFVIDHLAKPLIKDKQLEEWELDIMDIATNANVYCKLSGMVTEADWHNWKQEDLNPYIDVVAEAFGPDRIMFGSDWPVCLIAGSYKKITGIIQNYFQSFSIADQEKVWGGNAVSFYNLAAS